MVKWSQDHKATEMQPSVRSDVARAPSTFSPCAEVNQGSPVSETHPIEGLGPVTTSDPFVDGLGDRERPVVAPVDEGPTFEQGDKLPPFLLELFCGTAGVCVLSSGH